MAKEVIIGLDLGTSTSAVSWFNNGRPEIIANTEGARITPSVVAYTGDQILVGEAAKRQQITNPDKTIYSAKRFIGMKRVDVDAEAKRVPYAVEASAKGDAVFKVGDKKISPEEVGAEVLKKLKKSAEEFLGQEVKKAVITTPAWFNDQQRTATKDAGALAGLEVLRVINEPTAAALAFGFDKKKDQTIVVFDLGGGTFDVSCLSIGDNVFEVLSTSGDTHLGGDDADNMLVDWMADEFKKNEGIDLRKDKMALQRLKSEAEKTKKELSSVLEVDINIPFITADANGPKHLQTKITRARFESMISGLIDRCFECLDKTLKDAKKTTAEIDEILLVGGSTRIPMISDRIKKMFGKEPNKGVNPDEAVSLGAAIQGAIIAGDQSDLLLLDVMSLSLSIETLGGVSTVLIPRNTTIPTKKSQTFSNAQDNQTIVSIRVAQGERSMFSDNQLLGQFNLDGIPPCPKGTAQIEVGFDVDANGMVSVKATDKATGKTKDITIKSGLSKDEIDCMIKEAAENEADDKKKAELVRKFNELEGLIIGLRKLLDEQPEKLVGLKEEGAAAIKSAQEVLDSRKESELGAALEKIIKVSHRAAEICYKSPETSAAQEGAV